MLALAAIISACGGAETTNTNANTNMLVTNQANLPAEFQTSPVPPSGNTTPGIPAPGSIDITNSQKGGTPTPGIPDPATIGKTPVPKGATPTPGIPDPATLKRQMNNPVSNTSATPPATEAESNVKVKTVRKP